MKGIRTGSSRMQVSMKKRKTGDGEALQEQLSGEWIRIEEVG